MKIELKKLVGGVVVFIMLFSSVAFAADDPVSNDVDGNLSIGRCLVQGKLDFATFLNSSIYAEGLDGAIEQFKDIFGRNQCQGNDILALLNQRDKVRSLIRKAFLNCETEQMPQMKLAYYKLSAEIYYVRNVTDGAVALNLPFESLTTLMRKDPDKIFYPADKLYSEMHERYVPSGQIAESEFNQFFDQLRSKYEDRKKSYVICENSAWKEVGKKFQEFVDTAGGITPEWENLKKSVGGGAEKIIQSATDTTYQGYFDGILKLNVNNQPGLAGVEEILSNIGEFAPSTDTVTQDVLLGAVQGQNVAFDIASLENEMRSDFTTLYKKTSDDSLDIILTNLNELNDTIVDSLTPQSKILNCVETINNRQCPNKE